ncbi:hypothetical protein ICN48_08735 [Polynucleobacter sp. JS-Safj-400b-B2]|uniref:hypothetical protein n=1 Tax=Polynucleobacter sp. JS-Safj-400b-B2 TaxID=2576921 RepID=UPI001C0BD05E|nr:hypothetical protein [Polynucleobacter sp. JS-Safj-400b-B2]MBU3626319.1 hypothetical protein [Polynucleobacter sp. JS-Safj-400b-B2]
MNIRLINIAFLVLGTLFLSSACSVAKLEARLEANPQCKDVVNPKTGTLMPCPGSDKAFYREVGLAPAKPTPTINTSSAAPVAVGATSVVTSTSNTAIPAATSAAKSTPSQADCKPQIHKKTGGTLPCPAPD